MIFNELNINGVYNIELEKFVDQRGVFYRNFCRNEIIKKKLSFSTAQGNISINPYKYTLRGFHFQKKPSKESKIITVVQGEIFNVVIDLRKKSKDFLKNISINLSEKKNNSIFIPHGCANAFLTIKKNTIIQYYMSDYFDSKSYSGFRYDDKFFSIKWPKKPDYISKRDSSFKDFSLKTL